MSEKNVTIVSGSGTNMLAFCDTCLFLQVKRPISVYGGQLDFLIHTWDSQGRKMTLPVRLLHYGHHNNVHNHQNIEHDHGDHTLHGHQEHLPEVDSADDQEVKFTAKPLTPLSLINLLTV